MLEMKIVTIPTQISPVYPDKNGRLFHKKTMDTVFRQRGYLRPNLADKITITPIPVRFFTNVSEYREIIQTHGWDADIHMIENAFGLNTDISDKMLSGMQVMYLNDRYYLNIPIPKQLHGYYTEYFSTCYANAICTELRAVEGEYMGVNDILYFDIFPEN